MNIKTETVKMELTRTEMEILFEALDCQLCEDSFPSQGARYTADSLYKEIGIFLGLI